MLYLKEWLLGISCVQPEEKERIMKFVFKKDAKSALASTGIVMWSFSKIQLIARLKIGGSLVTRGN